MRPQITGAALNRNADPQKQHLVPFSYALALFGPGVRRTANHAFNNIGNLTYISAQENGLKCLNDDFADLVGERHDDVENMSAHLLSSDQGDDTLTHYEWLRGQLKHRDPENSDSHVTAMRRLDSAI